jgi:hypothetical protein
LKIIISWFIYNLLNNIKNIYKKANFIVSIRIKLSYQMIKYLYLFKNISFFNTKIKTNI